MNKILYIVLLTFHLNSCWQSDGNFDRVIDHHENGQIKSKRLYDSKLDTVNFVLQEYYINGEMKRTGPVKDSIVHGAWEYFYDNGNLAEKGNYIIDDSLNNGNWSLSYKLPLLDNNGDTIVEYDSWISSDAKRAREKKNLHVCKEGFWEFYYEDGQLKAKGNYKNGWSIGKWVEYAPNGQLILESNFKNTEPDGEWRYWYPNGQLMKIVQRTDSLDLLLLQAYDRDGTQKIFDGHGEFKQPNPNDTSESVFAEYHDGVFHGTYIKYFDNGKISVEGQFKNGKLEGNWIHYYYFYDKRFIRNFQNGEEHGCFYRFYTNGDTTEIRCFINGLEHGVTKNMNSQTGEITFIEPWDMGKRHGIRKFFNSDGEQTSADYFYQGDGIGYEIYKNGKLTKQVILEGEEERFLEITR
ncbi:MAG: hypothetical protein GQ574_07215 [Crocinitomix sp.]|nr:hypothetical protein [Crocinitomix sp.]